MKKKERVDQNTRLLYVLLRYEMDLGQGEFAAASRTAASQVSVYDRGERTVPQEVLERAADACGFPRVLLRPTRRAIRSFRAAARGWSRADRALTETFFLELLEVGGRALEAVAPAGRPPRQRTASVPGPEDRSAAAGLWSRLERRSPAQRVALVEEISDFQTWALSELVAAKSIEAAPENPAKALEVAELALRIAELCQGEDWLRQRTQGYAWFHVANARRAANDFPGSDVALAAATGLWDAGAAGDPGLFDEAVVLALEANIRKSQRRFPEALQRIGEALAADRGNLRGKLLLTKSQILQSLGHVEASTEVLREAVRHIDEKREPRTALGARCQLLLNLCLQDRAAEAAPQLSEVQGLAQELAQEVDLVRVAALGGLIAAGINRPEEAEKAFEQARSSFASFKPPLAFDYALVSLELGLLLLEQGRTSDVCILAEEMAWIFTQQGVHREALAALGIFCEAARRESATVELTRRVIRFLHRSQHDPELKFDDIGGRG